MYNCDKQKRPFLELRTLKIQCNLDLVTLLVSSKTVAKAHVTKSNDLFRKLENGLFKIITKSQVVTKSILHCTYPQKRVVSEVNSPH